MLITAFTEVTVIVSDMVRVSTVTDTNVDLKLRPPKVTLLASKPASLKVPLVNSRRLPLSATVDMALEKDLSQTEA